MSSAFFVVLPSNAQSYADNKPNKFKVRLPQKIILDGNYVVGLHSIQYSNSWSSIGTTEEQFIVVHYKDGRSFNLPIPKGSFLSPEQLANGLHSGIIRELETKKSASNENNRRKRNVVADEEIKPLPGEVIEENEEIEEEQELIRKKVLKTDDDESRDRVVVARENDKTTIRNVINKPNVDENEGSRRQQAIESHPKVPAVAAPPPRVAEDPSTALNVSDKETTVKPAPHLPPPPTKNLTNIQRQGGGGGAGNIERTDGDAGGKLAEDQHPSMKMAMDLPLERLIASHNRMSGRSGAAAAQMPPNLPQPQALVDNRKSGVLDTNRTREATSYLITDEYWLAPYEKGSVFKGIPELADEWRRAPIKDWITLKRLMEKKQQRTFSGFLSYQENVRRVKLDRFYIINELAERGSELYNQLLINVNDTEKFFKTLYEADYTKKDLTKDLGSLTDDERMMLNKISAAKSIKFNYDQNISRFVLQLTDPEIDYLQLSDQICYVLGYEVKSTLRDGDVARYSCDLKGGVSFLCCYTDIVEDLPFGDVMSPLLQIIAVSGKPG